MREAGLTEGVNYVFAARFADGVFDRLPGLALELAALKPRVIVASAAAAPAVHKVVPDLPMVFTSYAADPIKAGFAQSYVHPGGNATGNVMNAVGGEEALTQKRMGLFKELVPNLKRLGFIGTATSLLAMAELDALRSVTGQFGFDIVHHASTRSTTSKPPLRRARAMVWTRSMSLASRCSTTIWRRCCHSSWPRESRRSVPIPTGGVRDS